MSEYDLRVQEKAKKELMKKEQNSKLIQDQLYEYQVNYLKKMKQDKMEGKLMKKQVQEEIEREKMRELEKKKKAAKTREELKQANDDILRIR